MVFGVVTSNNDVMLSLIFPQGLRLNTETYIKCLDQESGFWRILHHATQPIIVWEKISAITLHQPFGHLTSQIPIPFIIVSGAVEWETNKTPCNTKDELKARIMVAITNLNQETIGKESLQKISKLSRDQSWSHWRFFGISFIHRISRYFHVNISGKYIRFSEMSELLSFLCNLDENLLIAPSTCSITDIE